MVSSGLISGPKTTVNSQGWSWQNFSLQFQSNINQANDENKEKYQLRGYKLIQYQILQSDIQIII